MNTTLSLGMPGGSEWIVLLFVVLLLFGGSRLPQLAKGLGESIREFKKGIAQIDFADEAREPARAQAQINSGVTGFDGIDESSRANSVA